MRDTNPIWPKSRRYDQVYYLVTIICEWPDIFVYPAGSASESPCVFFFVLFWRWRPHLPHRFQNNPYHWYTVAVSALPAYYSLLPTNCLFLRLVSPHPGSLHVTHEFGSHLGHECRKMLQIWLVLTCTPSFSVICRTCTVHLLLAHSLQPSEKHLPYPMIFSTYKIIFSQFSLTNWNILIYWNFTYTWIDGFI